MYSRDPLPFFGKNLPTPANFWLQAMERMQRLQAMEDMLRRLLAMAGEEMQTDAGAFPEAQQPAGAQQPAEVQPTAEHPPADDDAGAAAPVAELVEKTAVQVLQEKKAQRILIMLAPVYQRNQHDMWICKLSVNRKHFECSAAKQKDAYQLCAAAALEYFNLV